MKNLLSMLLVFSFLFTIGCEDDEATESEFNPLVGVWNMTSIVIESEGTTTIDADDDFNMVIIFNEDGTFSNQGAIDGESHSETGTWSTSENKLTIITDDAAEGEETDIWDYTLSGNSFLSMTIAENEDGYDFTYTYNFTKG